jgi:hypothetical protein
MTDHELHELAGTANHHPESLFGSHCGKKVQFELEFALRIVVFEFQ